MFFQPGWEQREKDGPLQKKLKIEDANKPSTALTEHKSSELSKAGPSSVRGDNKGKVKQSRESNVEGEKKVSEAITEHDKKGVADLVVKYLTPHYKAGRFANKVINFIKIIF